MIATIVVIFSLAEVVDYAPPVVYQIFPTIQRAIPEVGRVPAPTAALTTAVVLGKNGVVMH